MKLSWFWPFVPTVLNHLEFHIYYVILRFQVFAYLLGLHPSYWPALWKGKAQMQSYEAGHFYIDPREMYHNPHSLPTALWFINRIAVKTVKCLAQINKDFGHFFKFRSPIIYKKINQGVTYMPVLWDTFWNQWLFFFYELTNHFIISSSFTQK